MVLSRNLLAPAAFVVALCFSPSSFAATDQDPAEEQLVHNLLDCLMDDDYDRFMSYVTPAFGNVAARDFMFISAQIGPRLEQGYDVEYFGELEQMGYDISVWKISFEDQKDDVLATLNVQDGKVAGFFMQ